MNLKDVIRDYPDYPKKGIIFKDMWPAIENPDAFEQILTEFEKEFREYCIELFIITSLSKSNYFN